MTLRPYSILFVLLAGLSPLVAVAQGSAPSPSQAQPTSEPRRFKGFSESMLEGAWEGTLAMREPLSQTNRLKPADPNDIQLRVELTGQKARVYIRDEDRWSEAMPGMFIALRVFSNAAVVGAHGGGDASDGWIESWTVNLSALDDTTLLAEWARAVTNIAPGPEHLPAFSMAASGTLRRAKN